MLADNTYLGILRAAINVQTGEPHTDWRKSYVNRKGLIVIDPSHSVPGKYVVYLFMPFYNYFHTSRGDLQISEKKIRIETVHSIYEFEIEPGCVPEEEIPFLQAEADWYFTGKAQIGDFYFQQSSEYVEAATCQRLKKG